MKQQLFYSAQGFCGSAMWTGHSGIVLLLRDGRGLIWQDKWLLVAGTAGSGIIWRHLPLHIWCLRWNDAKAGLRWECQLKGEHMPVSEPWPSAQHGTTAVVALYLVARASWVSVSANKASPDPESEVMWCHFFHTPLAKASQAYLGLKKVDTDTPSWRYLSKTLQLCLKWTYLYTFKYR